MPGPIDVWAASSYGGAWRGAIVAYKERRAWHLARPLGEALALAVGEAAASVGVRGGVILVPMPSRPAAVRERGLDVTAHLARRAAATLRTAGLPTTVDRGLVLARGGVDQGGLGEAGRWQNRSHSLEARCRGTGTRIIVDDITTTGASIAAAWEALERAGTPASAGAVVAATERRIARGG